MAETVVAVRPETVFHLGGRVSGVVDPALVAPTFRSLRASSVALLAAAEAGRITRLVLIGSTDEPHGDEVCRRRPTARPRATPVRSRHRW
ncbi:MAG: hypothetical protein L0H64_19645 [Pseudonocardia sp.]|nr:hypothetical protein [Pseudonocardia sp.]